MKTGSKAHGGSWATRDKITLGMGTILGNESDYRISVIVTD